MNDHNEPTQTPELPPEVFAELLADALRATKDRPASATTIELARLAYAAGADAELEAICEWLREGRYSGVAIDLRTARRPKPVSLKQQALAYVERIQAGGMIDHNPAAMATIIRALESLPDAD
jgi:hypothetical protein